MRTWRLPKFPSVYHSLQTLFFLYTPASSSLEFILYPGMSQPLSQKPKKRKHVPIESTPDQQPSAKRAKKDKGKRKEVEGEFRAVKAWLDVSVPPVFANNMKAGVEEMLDSMLMRCVPYMITPT